MAEDWTAIAAEVSAAIAEVGFSATVTRKGAGGPTSPIMVDFTKVPEPDTFTVTVIDDGIKDRYVQGSLVTRKARVLTVSTAGATPQKDDTITVRGDEHQIEAVMPLAPGGVDLLYEVELAA